MCTSSELCFIFLVFCIFSCLYVMFDFVFYILIVFSNLCRVQGSFSLGVSAFFSSSNNSLTHIPLRIDSIKTLIDFTQLSNTIKRFTFPMFKTCVTGENI